MWRRRLTYSQVALFVAVISGMSAVGAQAQEPTISAPTPPAFAPNVLAPQETPATLVLGDTVILRFRTTADKLTPQQRVDSLEQRLARVLSVPDLRPADVAVYAPVNTAPSIYVIGRKLITIDPETARAAGGDDPLALATQWAKRLQQTLPFADWRRPNEHEPVISSNPPLTITTDMHQVGGGIGNVLLHDAAVLTLYGVQPGGVTAAERADLLTTRLNRAAFHPATAGADPVSVAPAPDGGADLIVNGTRLLTVTAHDAAINAQPTPMALAESWAANLRKAMGASAAPPAPPVPPLASSATRQEGTPRRR